MSSFKIIYEEYAQPVYRFLLSLTGSEDFAEELLSETFYRALKSIDKFEGRCSLYTWLCQIGKNLWLSECRRNSRFREIETTVLSVCDNSASVEEQIIDKETYRKILFIIQNLDDVYRDVFILHALADVKLKEIAMIYGKSESWARVTYFRAKQKILQEVNK